MKINNLPRSEVGRISVRPARILIVLDAKYKRMEFDPMILIDQTSFRLIPIVQYYHQKYEVLYPFRVILMRKDKFVV
jgi:hypothetical protein